MLSPILLLSCVNSRAQEVSSTTDTAEPQAVVITASRSQARIESMPLSTTIVSKEDIQKSPAQTLDQLLRNVPGLNFTSVPETQTDPTGHQTKMRGLGNAKVLVLLDGVPLMDPFYLTTQWFKAPLSNIDHIEIIRGGNSSLWGNMAVAGVVNIVSKRPKDDSGEVTVGVGSHGTTNISLTKNFIASDALRFNIAIDQLNSQGYDTIPANQMWRFPDWQPTTARDTNFQFTTFFTPSTDLQGYLRLGYHIQNQNINYEFGNNLQKSPDLSASITKTLEDRASVTATTWAQYVNFQKFNGASCYWQASSSTKCPSYTNLNANESQVNNDVVQYYTQNSSQGYHEQGASLIYSKYFTGLFKSLQLGLDYRRLSATDREYFFSAPTSLASTQNPNSNTAGTGEQAFSGIFAQTKFAPIEPLEITFSARIDGWNDSDRSDTRTNAVTGVTVGGAEPNLSKSAFDPSLAARYFVTDDLALRGAIYKAFRAPGFNNTMRTYGSPNPTIANPDLNPENLIGRELGMDYHKGPFSFSATYFDYDISNMVATYKISAAQYAAAPALVQTICGAGFVNCGGSSGYANFYTNNQDGQSRGLELIANWTVNPNLSLNASYTRTLSILTSETASITTPLDLQLAGTPANVANAGVTWRPINNLVTYLQAHYVGPMYYDTTSAGGPYQQGSSTVFDSSLRYAWSKTVDLSMSVNNIANRGYTEGTYTHNQPWGITLSMPRTAAAALTVKF